MGNSQPKTYNPYSYNANQIYKQNLYGNNGYNTMNPSSNDINYNISRILDYEEPTKYNYSETINWTDDLNSPDVLQNGTNSFNRYEQFKINKNLTSDNNMIDRELMNVNETFNNKIDTEFDNIQKIKNEYIKNIQDNAQKMTNSIDEQTKTYNISKNESQNNMQQLSATSDNEMDKINKILNNDKYNNISKTYEPQHNKQISATSDNEMNKINKILNNNKYDNTQKNMFDKPKSDNEMDKILNNDKYTNVPQKTYEASETEKLKNLINTQMGGCGCLSSATSPNPIDYSILKGGAKNNQKNEKKNENKNRNNKRESENNFEEDEDYEDEDFEDDEDLDEDEEDLDEDDDENEMKRMTEDSYVSENMNQINAVPFYSSESSISPNNYFRQLNKNRF